MEIRKDSKILSLLCSKGGEACLGTPPEDTLVMLFECVIIIIRNIIIYGLGWGSEQFMRYVAFYEVMRVRYTRRTSSSVLLNESYPKRFRGGDLNCF